MSCTCAGNSWHFAFFTYQRLKLGKQNKKLKFAELVWLGLTAGPDCHGSAFISEDFWCYSTKRWFPGCMQDNYHLVICHHCLEEKITDHLDFDWFGGRSGIWV
jgi:hypothetical protein